MASIREDHLSKVRDLASSVLAGVQRLETRQVHPSFDQETIDSYLEGTIKALVAADSSVWGAVADFEEEAL